MPLGASTYNGKIACFGQDDTYSYFQTGMTMTGTLQWGRVEEAVSGSAGHVDRQWFPRYAGGGGTGGDPRARVTRVAHDQPRQRCRPEHLAAVRPDESQCAATVFRCDDEYPDPMPTPECAEDIEVMSPATCAGRNRYAPWCRRWPRRGTCPTGTGSRLPTLDLDLTGEPLVAAPAHALPIEYMEGPYRYRGTLGGEPVSGFAFYERSLALYRDWELVDVLAAVGRHIVHTCH